MCKLCSSQSIQRAKQVQAIKARSPVQMKLFCRAVWMLGIAMTVVFASLGTTHAFPITSDSAHATVTVTYVANEGVLISNGSTQVLIDALHRPYRPEYLPTPPALIDQMMQGLPPFDSVDVVLVSHIHHDHFDASLVATYLEHQPTATLLATPQVADSVYTYLPSTTEQVQVGAYETGTWANFSAGGATIKMGKVAHVSERWRWIQNVAHVVEVAGVRLLHVGDPAFGAADLEALHVRAENIDVAILPSWFLTEAEGRTVIQDLIRPKALIAVYVTPRDAASVKARVASFYPDAVVFTTPMETFLYRAID